MQQFRASLFFTWYCIDVNQLRWILSVPNIILLSWLFDCQKLSTLMEIWRSSDKIKLGHFLDHPVFIVLVMACLFIHSFAVLLYFESLLMQYCWCNYCLGWLLFINLHHSKRKFVALFWLQSRKRPCHVTVDQIFCGII